MFQSQLQNQGYCGIKNALNKEMKKVPPSIYLWRMGQWLITFLKTLAKVWIVSINLVKISPPRLKALKPFKNSHANL